MTRYRILPALFVLACFVLACVPTFASRPTGHPGPDPYAQRYHVDMKSPRMQAARQQELAERSGQIASPSYYSGFTSHHTLYVNCTNSPAGSTYPTIQAALAVVQPYTTIKVCAGMYTGSNFVNTSFVNIVGQGSQGAVTITCAPSDLDGVQLNASHDYIQNVTVNNCTQSFGAAIIINPHASTPVTDDQVLHTFLNNDFGGAISLTCNRCEIENNEVSNNMFPIYSGNDVHDVIAGNEVLGDGTGNQNGIFVTGSVGIRVHNNRVSATFAGIELLFGTSLSDIEYNTVNGNKYGVDLIEGSNGNEIEHNTANGNTVDGFFADKTTGADSTVGMVPNRYLYNYAFGNGTYDYEDQTFPYSGTASGTNDGTANFYHGNHGNTAFPGQILTS